MHKRDAATTARIAVFDVVGTLFSLDVPRQHLQAAGAPEECFDLWFAQGLRDYFSRSLADSYTPLKDVLDATLPRALLLHGVELSEQDRQGVMNSLMKLRPAEGASAACRNFSDKGWQLVAVTNGSRSMAEQLFESADLTRYFSSIISCDEIGVSKPHRRVYDTVGQQYVGQKWLVAAHAWDVAGAKDAGWRTTWVASIERLYPQSFPEPDFRAKDLQQAADLMS